MTYVDNGNGTGTLAGTPGAGTATGSPYASTFTATNANGAPTQAFSLVISAGTVPAFTSANTTTFTVGVAGTFTVSASGSPAPSIVRTGAALPTGVTYVDNGNGTGTLAGTPGAATNGSYALTFTASNGNLPNAVQAFTLVISAGPTVTINQAVGQGDPTGISPINFTVVFSAVVTGFATGDVTIGGTAGATTATVTGSGTTYNVAVTGMTAAGTVSVTVPAGVAVDASARTNVASTSTDNTVAWSPGGPTVTINQAVGQLDPTNVSPINFTVVFSTAVSGFATGDVVITGTAGGTKTATVTGSGTTYTVAVTGMAAGGTVIATVPGSVAVDASARPNLASTSTDNTVTWTSTATSITLTTSAPTPPGAHDPVILWGQGFTLKAQFVMPGGNGKTFQLQGTRDGISWTGITTLTTDSSGLASLFYTPVTNLYYRAVFAGTPDLAAANSNQVRTVVRQLAVLRPTNSGSTRSINRNTSITFTTTVRPARPELAPAKVSFYFYRQVSGVYQLVTKRDVLIDANGLAKTTFKFTSAGQWYVRSQANPTPYNANSVMTPPERYSVR